VLASDTTIYEKVQQDYSWNGKNQRRCLFRCRRLTYVSTAKGGG
jgi:hypothetical protein